MSGLGWTKMHVYGNIYHIDKYNDGNNLSSS